MVPPMAKKRAPKTAKSKKGAGVTAPAEAEEPTDAESVGELEPPSRITRHVRPMGPRILVRLIKSPDRLDSGLYLPKGAKDEAAEALLAEVLEVARTMPDTITYYSDDEDGDREFEDLEGENVSGIPINAKVLFSRNRGVAVPWDESLRLLHVRHVLAIVDEIPEEHLQ
jgi:co-chaperonin GroES (HSP10)